MKIKVFTNRAFIGEFDSEEIMKGYKQISNGTIISLNGKSYVIGELSFKNDNTLKLEVY